MRSAWLLSLLGLLRLLAYSMPKKGGTCNADPVIDGMRRGLRGAPVSLVFAAQLCVAMAGKDDTWKFNDPWRHIIILDRNVQLAHSVTSAPPVVECVADQLAPGPYADEEHFIGLLPELPMADEADTDELPDGQDGARRAINWIAPVTVLDFQSFDSHYTIYATSEESEEEFLQSTRKAHFQVYIQVLPAMPTNRPL